MSRKNITDVQRLWRVGRTFNGMQTHEINGFLYRLGFSKSEQGFLHKKGVYGLDILVVESGVLSVDQVSGKFFNTTLTGEDWELLKKAYNKDWLIFFIVEYNRKHHRSGKAKELKNEESVILDAFGDSDHIVSLEVNKGQGRCFMHDVAYHAAPVVPKNVPLVAKKDPKRGKKMRKSLETFRKYVHRNIQIKLGLTTDEFRLEYQMIDFITIKDCCALYILWIIQEAVKGRHLPNLNASPALTMLFQEKVEFTIADSPEFPDEASCNNWQWTDSRWRYDEILDKIVLDDTITWRKVIKMKKEVDLTYPDVKKFPIDDDDNVVPTVRTWNPSF